MTVMGFGKDEVKIFFLCILVIITSSLLFVPPAQYNAMFWNYLNETPPILWASQAIWVIIGAFFLAIFYLIGKKVLS